jgi:hypothetical protein
MNWKLLSIALVGLTLVACEGKKEEKKAEEAHATPETAKVEEPKATPGTPAEEPKKDEHHKEEKKAS